MEVIATANFQPDIMVWGLRIGEPVIASTGILVSLVCFYAWARLGRLKLKEDSFRLARIFFLLTGLSMLIGGVVGHAFLYAIPFEFKLPGWTLGMIGVSALEQAAIARMRPLLSPAVAKALTYLNIAELTLALWLISATLWFPIAEIHAAFGLLLVVAPLEILLFVKTRSKGGVDILIGIFLLIIAALAHVVKASIGVWFSYFDIGHLLMGAAIWKIMQGVEKRGRQPLIKVGDDVPQSQVFLE